jgi:hypothetical protein
MRTRGEARREEEAAEERRAALLSAAERSDEEGTPVLEAALAAIGPPGSPPLLAALAHGDHALLRAACNQWREDTVAPLLRAYGESPDACAAAMRVLDGAYADAEPVVLWRACERGNLAAAVALLGAYRRAGRAQEALAANNHAALNFAATYGQPEIVRLLLEEYGEPGCAPVLAALAARGHYVLWVACFEGRARAAALLAAAYGPPGCAALREALSKASPAVFNRLIFPDIHPDDLARFEATLAALLAALAEPDCATAVRALGAWLEAPKSAASHDSGIRLFEPAQRLARIPPDSLLARLAVAAPAAWALNPDAARALLSAPLRSSLALPTLLALRWLPGGVAAPVAAFLRARPWLLCSGSCTEMVAGRLPT